MIGRAEFGYEVMGKQSRGEVGTVEHNAQVVMYASRSAWAEVVLEGRRATPPGVRGVREGKGRGRGGQRRVSDRMPGGGVTSGRRRSG